MKDYGEHLLIVLGVILGIALFFAPIGFAIGFLGRPFPAMGVVFAYIILLMPFVLKWGRKLD